MSRVAELAAKVAHQQKEIDFLKSQMIELQRQNAPKQPVADDGVRIFNASPILPREFPTPKELDALNAIIGRRYPNLAYTADDESGRQQFHNAFLYSWFAYRREKPSKEYALSYWTDTGQDWLRRHGFDGDISGRSLIAAAVVHGIVYTEPPYSSLGLALGEHIEPQKSAWKRVLAIRKCPDPVKQ